MSRVISKADALVEMVKAFEQNDKKRSNRISSVIQKALNNESKEHKYQEYIEITREEKKLFPVKVRKTYDGEMVDDRRVVVRLEDGCYEMIIGKNDNVSFNKIEDEN